MRHTVTTAKCATKLNRLYLCQCLFENCSSLPSLRGRDLQVLKFFFSYNWLRKEFGKCRVSSSPGLRPSWGSVIVLLGKTLYSRSASFFQSLI